MTRNLERGSPVYQAPEIYVDAPAAVHIPALKMMDIWSFAMVVFDLNPDTFVYRAEVIDTGALDLSVCRSPQAQHRTDGETQGTVAAAVLRRVSTTATNCMAASANSLRCVRDVHATQTTGC